MKGLFAMQGFSIMLKAMGIDPEAITAQINAAVSALDARFSRLEAQNAAILEALTRLDPSFVPPGIAEHMDENPLHPAAFNPPGPETGAVTNQGTEG